MMKIRWCSTLINIWVFTVWWERGEARRGPIWFPRKTLHPFGATQSTRPRAGSQHGWKEQKSLFYSILQFWGFFGGLFPTKPHRNPAFWGFLFLWFLAGGSSCGEGPRRVCQYHEFIFFPLKWIWFLSPWEDGVKCSLVILWCTPRDTFQDAKGWEIPKHHFIHQKRWNSVGRLKKKKKSHWIPPTSAAQFYPFNFSSGIPWEIPGGSYSRAVWGSTATGSQSQRQIPRDEEQDLPWPGSLVIRTSSKAPPKGLQNALPKIFPAPAATAHLALPRKKGE